MLTIVSVILVIALTFIAGFAIVAALYFRRLYRISKKVQKQYLDRISQLSISKGKLVNEVAEYRGYIHRQNAKIMSLSHKIKEDQSS